MAREGSTNRSTAVTGLILAATGLISAATTYLLTRADHDPPQPDRHAAQPATSSPTPQPLTDLGKGKQIIPDVPGDISTDAQIRWLRQQVELQLQDYRARTQQLESDNCALKAGVLDTRAVQIETNAGKRGAAARNNFESSTAEWLDCSPIDAGKSRAPLKSLQRAADAAIRSVQTPSAR